MVIHFFLSIKNGPVAGPAIKNNTGGLIEFSGFNRLPGSTYDISDGFSTMAWTSPGRRSNIFVTDDGLFAP
jgi:hypothetical protein